LTISSGNEYFGLMHGQPYLSRHCRQVVADNLLECQAGGTVAAPRLRRLRASANRRCRRRTIDSAQRLVTCQSLPWRH